MAAVLWQLMLMAFL